ncbi:MAG: DUF6356 family protein [Sphingomicrobium sp.]
MATDDRMIPQSRAGLGERLFSAHPRTLGMSYVVHGVGAAKIAFVLMGAGVACLIHSIVPGWFTQTAGKTVSDIYGDMQRRKAGAANPEQWSDYEI